MKVILQKDVKDLGKVGDLLNVKVGYARNFLFPRKLAAQATERNVKQFEHLKRVADLQKSKAVEGRKKIVSDLSGVVLDFKVQAGEDEKLFGSISSQDISKELSKKNFDIDKKDIELEEPIKFLGQHKAIVSLGESADLKAEITVSVERI